MFGDVFFILIYCNMLYQYNCQPGYGKKFILNVIYMASSYMLHSFFWDLL